MDELCMVAPGMSGQKALRSQLGRMAASGAVPKTFALIGERGCGKHTLAKGIAEALGLAMEDATESVSAEALAAMAERPVPALYAFDLSEIDERGQNILLKFAEEPPAGAYEAYLCERAEDVIPTLLNRCVAFRFAPYSADELRPFLPEGAEGALKWLSTPGQIAGVDWKLVPRMEETCDAIVSSMGRANLPNALSLANRLNLGKDYDRFDVRAFARMLGAKLSAAYASGNGEAGRMLFALCSRWKALCDHRVALAPFADALLLDLWEACRS